MARLASPRPAPLPLSPSFLSLLPLPLSHPLYDQCSQRKDVGKTRTCIIDDSNSRTLRSQTVDPALLLLDHLPFAFFPSVLAPYYCMCTR